MQLSIKQIESIQQSTRRFNLWVGAVRSGKTFASILRLIDLMKHGPEGDVMLIGVNRDSIQRNIVSQLYHLLSFPIPSSKTSQTKLYNRNIYFVGANDESAVRRIQGATLALAYVDEAACIPQPFWRMLLSRLSVKDAKLLTTLNPEGPQHWLKKEFIDRADELDLAYWHFVLTDNPSLDPAYIENIKKEYTGAWYKRYILGEWAVAHGLIYDNFDDVNIYLNPFDSPNYYIVGIDYGTTNATAAVLCGVRPNRWPQVTVEREYYFDSAKAGRSKSDEELAEDIKQFIGHYSVRSIYIDPAAASFKVALRQKDLPVLDANNDVLNGIRICHRFIGNKNILIHKSCKNLIEQMQTYSWDSKAADRGEDKPVKTSDHAVDGLRYAIASAFPEGEFSSPYENLSIEQIRRHVYNDQSIDQFYPAGNLGYM